MRKNLIRITKFIALGYVSHYTVVPFVKGMRFAWHDNADGIDKWVEWTLAEPKPNKK